jgi:hypothetical protein
MIGRAARREISTSHVTTGATPSVRVFRDRATVKLRVPLAAIVGRASSIGRKATVRVTTVRPEIVLASIVRGRIVLTTTGRAVTAAPGRSGHAGMIAMIVRAATMRTTARFSPSARPSAAAAPIASVHPMMSAATPAQSRNRKRPANGSRR